MRLVLSGRAPDVELGPLEWREVDEGFEVAELPVLAAGREVDRILLARIDPGRFRLLVRTRPAGDRELGDWMAALDALLVINGSYYARGGGPSTPLVSAGERLGPESYDARHGAFVAKPAFVGIRDLRNADWQTALAGAEEAMVSFPLLVAADGSSRASADPRWLANRSFIGQDGAGWILLGTTADAFFSLDRLAAFLREAPLDLTMALNLDGGPVACQGIAHGSYRRDFCGRWETNTKGGQLRLLQPLVGTPRVAMPIMLAVVPR